ncbi:MAG: metal ABC transporter ATP-binding protein [Hydrogenovibrio crunogenus]|uniref:Zinc import ATP-binding protein ZnuC n=1 Tax=Hydrogenovibrio crunogenus (strain DSM 25203 / XCL-2) TaxID=317025 RepID=ZNUC_HYDCU|nr:RecName: Full=Zinc import ATP-binding protein ZnuC [Hydrogenovibrio crunogenus XCL-2]MBD3612138.1 metal ABC transporter ATP-binding protein [Hydrogenovibrio crunogenus]
MTTSPLITAKNINHAYGNKTVLNDISLTLHSNEIVTLIGPNGAGKSTLLKILLNLIQPTSGEVTRKTGLRIGFMPQKIQVDASMPLSVQRFLELGLARQSQTLFNKKTNDTTELHEVINDLKLNDLLTHPIQQVSGGEMQRILLARALLRNPELLILDEPVQGVDLQGQTELYHYISEIRDKYGCGILMVSHDLHIVMRSTNKVLCLNQHLCCSGLPQTVSGSPAFQELFGQGFEEVAFYEHHHDDRVCTHTHGHTET